MHGRDMTSIFYSFCRYFEHCLLQNVTNTSYFIPLPQVFQVATTQGRWYILRSPLGLMRASGLFPVVPPSHITRVGVAQRKIIKF